VIPYKRVQYLSAYVIQLAHKEMLEAIKCPLHTFYFCKVAFRPIFNFSVPSMSSASANISGDFLHAVKITVFFLSLIAFKTGLKTGLFFLRQQTAVSPIPVDHSEGLS